MKRPSAAKLKRVTAENLVRLGPDRLAAILLEVAATRVELKRRLRMELAAEQGAEHLLPEVDRRLGLLATSRGAVSWRQRPAFVRDLDSLRDLITDRLGVLDAAAAQDRILAFLRLSAGARARVRDKDGEVAAVFTHAAQDALRLLARLEAPEAGARLVEAVEDQPVEWSHWIETALRDDQPDLARAALGFAAGRIGPAWAAVRRRLAHVAGDPAAFAATYTSESLRMPALAASVAVRYLGGGDPESARRVLEGAITPALFPQAVGGAGRLDFAWEGAWIDYLEQVGRREEAQAARWASFTRTLSADRARAFVRRLPDFEDVAAEEQILAIAADWPDAGAALDFLMTWPAHREAALLVSAQGEALRPSPEDAERYARELRRRYPEAAERLLRRGAAEAFRRREFKASHRLTEEADALAT